MVAPRITLLLLAYRQPEHVEAAVHSALAQVCEPIEIVLSDDASPDDTFDRMVAAARGYKGPHRLVLNRNERNLGIGAHYNRLVELSTGELLITQAGDDISLPQRVARIAEAWDEKEGRPDLIASHLLDMDAHGDDHGWLKVDDLARWHSVEDWKRRRPLVIGAAHAFTKRLHRRFGPFLDGLTYEDQANVLRALCSGGAITLQDALVRYRRGGLSSGLQYFDEAAFLTWCRRRNRGHLALHHQWLRDASLTGVAGLVEQATKREHDRELYIARLLEARSRYEVLHEALKAREASLAWRLRKALQVAYPRAAARRLRFRG